MAVTAMPALLLQAAQRRVLASTGPLSVSDIKKRKEQQQLMQKLGKKQKSMPGATGSMPPLGPSAASAARDATSSATLRTPSARSTPADAARRISAASAASAQPEPGGLAASTPLRRTSSAGAPGSGGSSQVPQSPGQPPTQHGSPLHRDHWQQPEVGGSGVLQMSPGGAGAAPEADAPADAEEPRRGLSTLLQITQHAAAQQVRERREMLQVPWQVAEASLDEARKMMAAVRRGVRFHPEVRAALEAALAQVRSMPSRHGPDRLSARLAQPDFGCFCSSISHHL